MSDRQLTGPPRFRRHHQIPAHKRKRGGGSKIHSEFNVSVGSIGHWPERILARIVSVTRKVKISQDRLLHVAVSQNAASHQIICAATSSIVQKSGENGVYGIGNSDFKVLVRIFEPAVFSKQEVEIETAILVIHVEERMPVLLPLLQDRYRVLNASEVEFIS